MWKYISLGLTTVSNAAMKLVPILQQSSEEQSIDNTKTQFILLLGFLSMLYSVRNRFSKMQKDDRMKTIMTIKLLHRIKALQKPPFKAIQVTIEQSDEGCYADDERRTPTPPATAIDIKTPLINTPLERKITSPENTFSMKPTTSLSTWFPPINLSANICALSTNFIASTGSLLTLIQLTPQYSQLHQSREPLAFFEKALIYSLIFIISGAAIDQFYRLRMKDNARNIHKLKDYLVTPSCSPQYISFMVFLACSFFTYFIWNNYRGDELVKTAFDLSIDYWNTTATTSESMSNTSSLLQKNSVSYANHYHWLFDFWGYFTAVGGLIVTASNTQESTNFLDKIKKISFSCMKRFRHSNAIEKIDMMALFILCASSQIIGYKGSISSANIFKLNDPLSQQVWSIWIEFSSILTQFTSLIFDLSKNHFPNMEKIEEKLNNLLVSTIIKSIPINEEKDQQSNYVILSTRSRHVMKNLSQPHKNPFITEMRDALFQAMNSNKSDEHTLRFLLNQKQQLKSKHFPHSNNTAASKSSFSAITHNSTLEQKTVRCCSKAKTDALVKWLLLLNLAETNRLSFRPNDNAEQCSHIRPEIYFLLLQNHTQQTHPILNKFHQENEQGYMQASGIIKKPEYKVCVNNSHDLTLFLSIKTTEQGTIDQQSSEQDDLFFI